jgi:lysophospholipase L1-like esterase
VTPSTGPSPRVQFALLAALIVSAFAGIEMAFSRMAEPSLAGTDVVDIRSADALAARLEYLRRFNGYKCVLLGDSLIVGQSMRDHGDPDWHLHTLGVLLDQRLRLLMPGRTVLVMNLGSNGAVPADLNELGRILAPLAPDLFIVDVGLRSFSTDFKGQNRMTLPWLVEFPTPALDRPVVASDPGRHPADRAIADGLAAHWALYRTRDLQQDRVFEGTPRDAVSHWRDSQVRRQPAPASDDFDAKVELLFKARSRYAAVDLSADGDQRQAFERFVRRLAKANDRTMIFYASENPDVKDQLLDPERYAKLRGQLFDTIRPTLSDRFHYHVGAEPIPAARYLDHVHIDAEGYILLAQELWPSIEAIIRAQ